MKVLEPNLTPWWVGIKRRHVPPQAKGRDGYQAFRSCLRWEFGFTCPFCLCHEADVAPRGAEKSGVFQVEHFVPKSYDKAGRNVYANCFLICRFCNMARGAKPNIDLTEGGRLLNPCSDIWAKHFFVARDGVKVRRSSDIDAKYTQAAYELNAPRKVETRRFRRETIEECLDLLERGLRLHNRLLDKAVEDGRPDLVDEAAFIQGALLNAWRDLAVFQVVPRDARSPCSCGNAKHCSIPRHLEEQSVDIEPPLVK